MPSLAMVSCPVRDYPGHKPPLSVPFGGRNGFRRPPKERPKLTKVQKKALKWARKHPEPAPIRHTNSSATVTFTFTPSVTSTPTIADTVEMTLQRFVGQPVGPQTYAMIGNEVHRQLERAAMYHPGVYLPTTAAITNTFTVTSTSTNTCTVSLPMWTAWNANFTDTTAGWVRHDNKTAPQAWRAWQGKGQSYDFAIDPNDQLRKRRVTNERRLAAEADFQRGRMEAAAAEAERQRLWAAGAAEREKERVAAEERRKTALARSYELLYRHLTDEQKAMLESESRFLIEVNSGKVYEIRRGMHQNVYRLDDSGRAVEQLCCLPRGNVPEGDVMLAQMLHLMCNEDYFRSKANRWELRDMSPIDRRLPLAGQVAPSRENRIMLPAEAPRLVA